MLTGMLGLFSLPSAGQENTTSALFVKGNELMMKGFSNTDNTSLGDVQDKSNGHIKNPSIKEARAIWKQLLGKDPTNADVNFKLGLCYLISYDEKAKALPFLMLASKNMSTTYSFRASTGKAPAYALYFLAEAFIENNQPDSALKYFTLYKNQYQVPPMNPDRESFMCINAKNSMKNPRNVKVVNLTSLNSEYAETNPVVKLDNSMLFFSSRRPVQGDTGKAGNELSEHIYYSTKDASGKWGEPVPFRFNTKFDEAPLCISTDGLTLYFRRYRNHNDDIYISKFKDGVWNTPEPFTEINSKSNEIGLTFTSDGKSLYFSSDRPGGLGGYDIYKCVQAANGKWGTPENLGFPINTPLNEVAPNLNADGKTLFFSTDGNSNSGLGGQDIYYSEFQSPSNKWSEPQNMGYPINTTRDDINFYSAGEGRRYYSRINEGKSYDLFEIEGGGFDFDNVAAGTEVVTVTKEMNVTQVVETEKEVQKEVDVVQAVETEVQVEKEVEVIKTLEVEVDRKTPKPDSAATATGMAADTTAGKAAGTAAGKTDETASAGTGAKVDDKTAKTEERAKANADNSKADIPVKEAELKMFETIYFDFDKSDLSQSSLKELKPLIDQLKRHPESRLEIVGHTDIKGAWKYNVVLSERRAQQVRDFLIRYNISTDRLLCYGRGPLAPKTPNDTDENRKMNRRVEITVLQ